MKVIIPMAGMGTRLRPFTLQTPKPLIKVAGKTIVEHLLNNLQSASDEEITEVNFVIGDFPDEIKKRIENIARNLNVNFNIYTQSVPLGTAHAVYMAKEKLHGKVIIAFADTIFFTENKIPTETDAVIFTKEVDNPNQYGVVKFASTGDRIIDFVEKPKTYVSNQAIIGIYYFKNAEILKNKLDYLIENSITVKGEYQLTDALSMLLKDGLIFKALETKYWLDCGNPQMLLNTTTTILEKLHKNTNYNEKNIKNSIIIPPVYIAENAVIENSIIGPFTSIENNVRIKNSILKNSIILDNTVIKHCNFKNSIIGQNVEISGKQKQLFIGDYSKMIGDETS